MESDPSLEQLSTTMTSQDRKKSCIANDCSKLGKCTAALRHGMITLTAEPSSDNFPHSQPLCLSFGVPVFLGVDYALFPSEKMFCSRPACQSHRSTPFRFTNTKHDALCHCLTVTFLYKVSGHTIDHSFWNACRSSGHTRLRLRFEPVQILKQPRRRRK
jgi:hypothetical protein